MYTLLIFWFIHVLQISVKKWFCVYSFSSNTILVLIVNSPVDYYIAGMRTNLPTGWSYTVSDLRMANVPTAGLCITVEMGEYSWPITAITYTWWRFHSSDRPLWGNATNGSNLVKPWWSVLPSPGTYVWFCFVFSLKFSVFTILPREKN